MAISYEQLQSIIDTYPKEVAYKIFAGGNLTLPEFISGNRGNMFTQHLEHFLSPIESETPLVSTGYEKVYGKYTDSYKVADADYKVIAVVPKFKQLGRFKYIYILQNVITKIYDVIEVSHYECMNENRGYLRPYTEGDNFVEGQIIKKGTTIYRSNNHDEYGNYRYGLNPKTVAISLPENEEDGIPISQSFYERGSFYVFRKIPISLNKNQILINYYGDDINYKCIPNLGEAVKDNILYIKRNINYNNAPAELTDKALRMIVSSDEICYGSGHVADIDIWVNDLKEFENCPNKTQLYQYYYMINEYNQKLYDILNPIVEGNTKGIQYTYRLRWVYEHARNYLDKNIQWLNNNNNFEFAHLVITVYEKKNIFNGYKLTDRFGGKGTIACVIPDKYMPRDEYGNVADVILSPPSTPARSNPGQWYETDFNFISDMIAKRIQKFTTIREKETLLIDFLMDVNPKEGSMFVNWWKKQNDVTKMNTFNDIHELGIILVKEPFDGQFSIDKLEYLYKKYNIKPSKITTFRRFKDNLTSLPIKTEKEVMITGDLDNKSCEYATAINWMLPEDLKDKGIFSVTKEKLQQEYFGATPFDIKKGEDYVNNGPGIFPTLDEKGNFKFNSVSQEDLEAYRRGEIFLNKMKNSGNEVEAFYDEDGYLVRKYKSLNNVIISRKYYMILKQIPDEKFSARSLGTINQMCIPNKSGKQSNMMNAYSKNAIRNGEMENDNYFIRMNPEIVHRFFATHSVNPELREQLATMLLTEDPRQSHDLPINNEDIRDDAPAILFHSTLFAIGLEIVPIYEDVEEDEEEFDGVGDRKAI